MNRSFAQRLLELVHRPAPDPEIFADILYEMSRIRTLDQSLALYPEMICRALRLESFRVFLRDGAEFRLRQAENAVRREVYAFPASSSTVLRMKRAQGLARFGTAAPDGWQLLATEREVETLRELGGDLLLPLEGRTALTGFAVLGRGGHGEKAEFSAAELAFLERVGMELGHSLETAMLVDRLSQEAVRRAHMTRELELAREVQERLLPGRLPKMFGLDSAAAYRSAEQIGGDYFDLLPVGEGLLCGVIADVSGHGIAAALLMATLRASLHGLAEQAVQDLPRVMERLNRLLYSASSPSRYSTVFLMLYDAGSGDLRYVNAGHNPPLLVRRDGRVEWLTEGGTVVGLLPTAVWEEGRAGLDAGDVLVLYTDGVTEACNREGEEWGEAGLLRAVRGAPAADAEAQVAHVLEGLDGFTGGAAQDDDRTLVMLRRV